MFFNGTRNIAILTGYLATTEVPGVRRLFQNVNSLTYTTIFVSKDCAIGHMAPVDLSGPIALRDGELGIEAAFIGPASARSMAGSSGFLRTGNAPNIECIDFNPLAEGWVINAEVAAQLSDGPSTWGITDADEMAGWVSEGIANPPKGRLMNRVIVSGLPVRFGRRIDLGDRIYNPVTLELDGEGRGVEVRLYNEMRFWSSVARIVAGALSPVTVTGTFRAKFDKESGKRVVFIDAVDVYAATVDDLPGGIPDWMAQRIQSAVERRRVDLSPASVAANQAPLIGAGGP